MVGDCVHTHSINGRCWYWNGFSMDMAIYKEVKMNFTDNPEKTLCDRCDTVIIYTEHGPRLCQYHSRRHDTTFTGYLQKRFITAEDFLSNLTL